MKRLIVGSLVSASLYVSLACSGDPTESLRNGIQQVNAAPTQVFVQLGRTSNVDATATDEQGNLITTSFEASGASSALTVIRDTTFQPIFVNDTQAVAPAEATTFRFKVTANALAADTFTITAGGKSVDVPVSVTRDPLQPPPLATVVSSGATASDTTVLSIPAPFAFPPDVTVSFDAGNAIIVGRAPDGSSISIFPPPGTTSTGAALIALNYLPTDTVSTSTDVPLTIATTVPARQGTDDPTTAPDITPPAGGTNAFYDGTAFASPVCGQFNSGVPCQLYKIVLPADGSFDVALGSSNTTDLGVYLLSADGTQDIGDNNTPFAFPPGSPCDVNGNDGTPESCTWTLTAGTYLLGVTNFGPFYSPPDPVPDWISLTITRP